MLRAVVSIHDVMPSTRSAVTQLLQRLTQCAPKLDCSQITLLVVPGKPWSNDDIGWLQSLVKSGHPLAGHGWSHQAQTPRTPYHVLHSLLLSRNAAEHLSCQPDQLVSLLMRCHRWFAQSDLPQPTLYVPPAWAAGCLSLSQWQALPFQQLETLSGVYELATGRRYTLPLTGYEADTPIRALFLKMFNQWNLQQAQNTQRPLRISLHPFDLQYALAQNAIQHLTAVDEFIAYSQLHSSGRAT